MLLFESAYLLGYFTYSSKYISSISYHLAILINSKGNRAKMKKREAVI